MRLFMARYPEAREDEEKACRWVTQNLERFPRDNCVIASLVLNHRLANEGNLLDTLYANKKVRHTVVDVGTIEEQEHTIVDITGHQFRTGLRSHGSKLYIGPIVHPYVPLGYFPSIELPLPTHDLHVEPRRLFMPSLTNR